MVQCAIAGCRSRSDTQPSVFLESAVHFHRIPKATLIRRKWMQAINKSEVNTSTRVCSLHFKKENYYLTKQGFHKLTGGSVPEIKLPVRYLEASTDEKMTNVLPPEPNIEYRTTDDLGLSNIMSNQSCDEKMSNMQPPEQNITYQSQSQQTNTKEVTPEIGTTDNVLGSTSIEHAERDNGDTTDSSKNEKMSNVQPQNINLPNQCQQNNSKEMTTENVKESTILKPGVQKHKVKTLLERKLLKEVRRLQEQGKKRMEAIKCLLEQNRRLLDRNNFLEQALNNCKNSQEMWIM